MKDITITEMERLDGGAVIIIVPVAKALLTAVGVHVINNWDDFKAGLLGQPKR